jgi:hypothetical protein
VTVRRDDHERLIRSIGTGRMTREQLFACLAELADRVSSAGVEARLLLVGGAALSLCYDRPQGTADIDAAVSPTDPVLTAAAAMAARYGLHERWLNRA